MSKRARFDQGCQIISECLPIELFNKFQTSGKFDCQNGQDCPGSGQKITNTRVCCFKKRLHLIRSQVSEGRALGGFAGRLAEVHVRGGAARLRRRPPASGWGHKARNPFVARVRNNLQVKITTDIILEVLGIRQKMFPR